jgi:hypothetical protein
MTLGTARRRGHIGDRAYGDVPDRPGVRAQQSGRPRGQAVVEFALILPVLLLLTVAVVDMTRVFTAYIALTNGIRESVIYSVSPKYTSGLSSGTWPADHWCSDQPSPLIPCPPGATGHKFPDPDNIAARMEGETRGMDQSAITLSAPVCKTAASAVVPCADANAQTVTVGASYRMPILTPVLSTIIGGPLKMSSSAVGRIMK